MQLTYLIGTAETIVTVKIGKSVKPEERLSTLQTGNSQELVLITTTSLLEEKSLHQRYSQYRGRGEWFDLPLKVFLDLVGEFNNTRKDSNLSGTIDLTSSEVRAAPSSIPTNSNKKTRPSAEASAKAAKASAVYQDQQDQQNQIKFDQYQARSNLGKVLAESNRQLAAFLQKRHFTSPPDIFKPTQPTTRPYHKPLFSTAKVTRSHFTRVLSSGELSQANYANLEEQVMTLTTIQDKAEAIDLESLMDLFKPKLMSTESSLATFKANNGSKSSMIDLILLSDEGFEYLGDLVLSQYGCVYPPGQASLMTRYQECFPEEVSKFIRSGDC